FGRWLTLDRTSFAVVAGGLGVLFGAGGFAALWGAGHPLRFAALSAATPIAILALSYGRFVGLGVDRGWAAAGLGLALIELGAAQRLGPWQRSDDGSRAALAAYAAGVVTSLALAATMALRQAWLTVALSALLPGLAW